MPIRIVLLLLTPAFIFGCKKFVTVVPPKTSITASNTYNNDASAAAVMSGVYSTIIGGSSNGLGGGNASIALLEGLAADELTNYTTSGAPLQFYQNAPSSSTNGISNSYWWNEMYREIHVADVVIEGLAKSTGVTPGAKRRLDGEAKFIRAFYFFYAVNVYGDVPLALTTDYVGNDVIVRSPKADVYKQIIKDLTDAKAELSSNFVDPFGNTTTERIRPSKGAAQALLARAYLYTGDWAHAKSEADSVVANPNFALLTDLTGVFKKNSSEAIWQAAPPTSFNVTWDAEYFVLTAPPGPTGTLFVSLSDTVMHAFEPLDNRLLSWVGTYNASDGTVYRYPFKYRANASTSTPATEYLMILRLAEQYLIRAEARAQLDDIAGAQADLNAIRTRANLPATTATDKPGLLDAIMHERQTELFTEWGHRWFDLIRTGRVNAVMGSPGNVCKAKGGTWDPNWTLAPLPLSEISLNPNLTQNPGYN